MSREQKRNYMSFYRGYRRGGEWFRVHPSTPPSGSTGSDWAERLRDKYGIAQPMAPDDGLDEEHGAPRERREALN
jgi:hypothetical protein